MLLSLTVEYGPHKHIGVCRFNHLAAEGARDLAPVLREGAWVSTITRKEKKRKGKERKAKRGGGGGQHMHKECKAKRGEGEEREKERKGKEVTRTHARTHRADVTGVLLRHHPLGVGHASKGIPAGIDQAHEGV